MIGRRIYAGLFAVSLATLMYEILLTRIFSVTMWYHLAFMSISIALFGMTVGGLLVYLLPNYFTVERAKRQLAASALLFAASAVAGVIIHLNVRFVPQVAAENLLPFAVTYAAISIPFVMSGVCTCLALTRFPQQVSKLYAANLAGAALGCVMLIYVLGLTDGPTAVVAVAFMAAAGAALFASEAGDRKTLAAAVACSVLLALFAGVNTALVWNQTPLIRPAWVKLETEEPPTYEKWNSFSRIAVWDPKEPTWPMGWGFGTAYEFNQTVGQMFMNIDAAAGTVITAFDGDVGKLDYLKYDITNVVHYMRPGSRVLIVGSGGGRDVLSALVFNQTSVVAVDINGDIIDTVNVRFGDFTGHLDRNPKVSFVKDEARSYTARQTGKFDVIHISLIDTWAATAAGAFVLSENSLYTVEAWDNFLGHLTPGGVLTVTRWYVKSRPGEIYRMTALASASLMRAGVENPRDHIILLKVMRKGEAKGVGTLLVSRNPFSEKDLDAVEGLAKRVGFAVVISPRSSSDPSLQAIASGRGLEKFVSEYPLNVAPPTDDSPFFFNMLRFRDMFNRELWNQSDMSFNMMAVNILGSLLAVILVLTLLCVIVPFLLTASRESLKGSSPLFLFFAGIGLGYMLVEISQMQRLIIFLGHPTYGLSVLLFSLLLSSGLGSYSTNSVEYSAIRASGVKRLTALLILLFAFGLITPHVIRLFDASVTPVRIALAVALIFPIGFFMGMAFPLGMKAASARSDHLTPWLWGINGTTSVFASVLAVAIALDSGISVSYWVGAACYVVALLAFLRATRQAAG